MKSDFDIAFYEIHRVTGETTRPTEADLAIARAAKLEALKEAQKTNRYNKSWSLMDAWFTTAIRAQYRSLERRLHGTVLRTRRRER